ncbi:hypothetical protein [Synechococcus sp. MIT S9503]|uniref:hypothetical protein n=1 Tax=Synechococcus sp. MIT S9503 TaxID=3082547 RepID=UPI0039A62E93
MPRQSLFALVMAAGLLVVVIWSGLGLGLRPALDHDRDTVIELMEGPSGLEEVRLSEELVREYPFIYAGIQLDKIYELNLNSRTFTADGEIWLEWLPDVEALLQKHGDDPADLITLANRIETWDSTFEPSSDAPHELSGGRRQQLYHFSSRFYDDEVDFRRDPFDMLRLPVIVELKPLWTSQKYADLRLLPEPSNDNLVGKWGP